MPIEQLLSTAAAAAPAPVALGGLEVGAGPPRPAELGEIAAPTVPQPLSLEELGQPPAASDEPPKPPAAPANPPERGSRRR